MALLHVDNLYKGFSGETLFKNISFSIDEKDKIGVIGINGAGKTTLIKMLLEEEENDVDPSTNQRGTISKKGNLRIGYLSQNINLNYENTVFDELMLVFGSVLEDYKKIQELSFRINLEPDNFDKIMEELAVVTTRYEQEEGYAIEYKVKQILNGLSVQEDLWKQKIGDLSGGQKSRVALGKILLEEPELLILDEPTNHLDLVAIEWLEKFLKDYNKAVMVVSHDRYFLDNVVGRIFEIEGHTLKTYKGNFTEYTIQKEVYLSGAMKAFEKEQEKIKQMEEYIRRYKAGIKSKQARGRESLLNRMEKMENPVVNVRKMKLKFDIDRPSVDRVLKIQNLSKSYDGKKIFQNLNLEIFRGERVGIIGKNGVGKSTLLKIINGTEKADSGVVTIGEKVTIGYYDQNHKGLDEKASILNEFMFNYPMSEEDVRRLAGGFLFPEEDVFKIIGSLSGGEKARVTLMKLILKKANFLVLDEPTNHLDIYSREVLEEALEDYQGTILIVSHDRYFLEGIVNTIYEITENGAEKFHGNYKEYCERKNKPVVEKDTKGVNDYEEQKRVKNRISSLEKKYNETEKFIEKLEEKKSLLEEDYNQAGKENNLDKLLEIQEKMEKLDDEIMESMEKWEDIEKELKILKKAL
ncbi:MULTISPECIES: ABC-F family ATP-binding cassette domain-containing protein [Fusobacterium]|uniref:ABC-F family ATP-binding cassette domain-containing protein n=1 Tax=Fusobacterium TaxID=848 RepID=UPI001F41461E|nr:MULTISPECIES: ABC-F family ATP-binding cassette domain-containing protein [Fusobacterium]MCF2612906.1 ABC-F family ATP-binding cassette domain-containing protein [Fusobacterium perfoetens]MDY2981047.1 ABC-F family ATP-binding cassette domain-containing protein [Fusobacterium sp.]